MEILHCVKQKCLEVERRKRNNHMGLKDELRKINERLDVAEGKEEKKVEKKPKKFSIPFFKRVNPKQAKQNYVTVFKINENGFIDVKKEKIVEQTIIVDGIPRLATPEYNLFMGKNPVIIQPSWSVKPLSPAEEARKSLNDGSNTKGYQILMARMKSDKLNGLKQVGGITKIVIGVIFAVIIGYALMTGGG